MAFVSVRPRRGFEDVSVPTPNVVAVVLLAIPTILGLVQTLNTDNPCWGLGGAAIGALLMQAPKVAQQWERAIVLRLGRFHSMRGPGLFWIVPFVDNVSSWIDQRTITTSFAAEQTLTSDTV